MLTKAFRIFVSSTFEDFGDERQLLQDEVFPALETHCSTRGFGFRAIDLRWGVNEHAQLNQRTAEICLGEVVESTGYPPPNLLILIGDRYGWVPIPFAIARDEFEAARAWLQAQGKTEPVAELDRVYRLDENHLISAGLRNGESAARIGAYALLSREDELVDLKQPAAWKAVETRLREALQAAAHHLHTSGLLDDAGREKYFLSLTEQEIRQGPETLTGGDGKTAAHAIAWLHTTVAGEPGAQSLAAAVRGALPDGNVLGVDATRGGELYRAAFVEKITKRFIEAINAHIAEVNASGQTALQTERVVHDDFAAKRLTVFAGRKSNLAAIPAYIAGDARHPLVLTGISGSGKTALMAKAAAEAAAEAKVVRRFVGASSPSTNQRTLLTSVFDDLVDLGVAERPQWEDDDNRFTNQVRDLLSALDRPVAIFIDALDQLQAPYRPAWLPAVLNGKVKLIVSVLDDEAFVQEREIVQGLRRSLPAEAFLAIEPLGSSDGRDVLLGLEDEAVRALQPAQRDFILQRFRETGGSPLYLRIAFAIARRWRSTDDSQAHGLKDTVPELIEQFIEELWSVEHHDELLVRRALGLIAAGRDDHGLCESEIIGVLSPRKAIGAAMVMATEVIKAISASSEGYVVQPDRLPDSLWVRLRRSLSALLVEKGIEGEPLVSFFHRQMKEVVREQFYEPEKIALHRALAAYFEPPPKDDETEFAFSRRGLIELPFQLHHAGEHARLDVVLTDAARIEAKTITFGGVTELVEDYRAFAKQPFQRQLGRTLSLVASIIARDPRQLMSQLHGRLLAEAPADFLDTLLARIPDGAFIETRPTLTPAGGAEEMRLEGHSGRIDALAVLPDGRLASGSDDETIRLWDPATGEQTAQLEGHDRGVRALAVLPDGRLASGSDDTTIRLWDPTSCRETARLEGHSGEVYALALLPDGRLASGSADKTIRLWDLATGRETTRLEGHGDWVGALAVLPDGRLVSWSVDATIRFWDLATGREAARLEAFGDFCALAVLSDGRLASGSDETTLWDPASGRATARLEGHGSEIRALIVLPDGRLASGSDDKIIRLWDPRTGKETDQLEGHVDGVGALAVLPDGRLASGSDDKTIRLWDPSTGRETARQKNPSNGVRALAMLPDGRLASGSADRTIRIWDPDTGEQTALLMGHRDVVSALAVLADGRLASGSWDKSIRLWDLATGRETTRLEGHDDAVIALALLPDGQLASRSLDRTIRLWDPATGRETARLVRTEGYGFEYSALAVLPDGRLASGSNDKTIRLWDPASGQQENAQLRGHPDVVHALAVLTDGRLASGSRGPILLWDPASGLRAGRLGGHGGVVCALTVMPDGRLASGSDDRTIRLWDPAAGRETARLETDGPIHALASLPDGRLAAGDNLGRIHWLAFRRQLPSASALTLKSHFAMKSLPILLAHSPQNQLAAARSRIVHLLRARSRDLQMQGRNTSTSKMDPASLVHNRYSAAKQQSMPTATGAHATNWPVVLAAFLILLAIAFAAARWGPQFGFPAVHDVLTALCALLPQR